MMISPVSIYEEFQDKSENEIKKEIEEYKKYIKETKYEAEHPEFIDTFLPSVKTMINSYYEYIEQLIKLLSDKGYIYQKSDEENNAKLFYDKLDNLDYFNFKIIDNKYNEHKFIIKFSNEIVKFIYNNLVDNQIVENESIISKSDVLDYLEQSHVGYWENHYSLEKYRIIADDGRKWQLVFNFIDGSSKEFYGNNAYPYNFNDFIENIYFITGIEIDY